VLTVGIHFYSGSANCGGLIDPKTNGLTNRYWTVACLYWTVACLAVSAVSLWGLSPMIRVGMQLGLLMPLLAAVARLAIVGIGIAFYRESASVRPL
jgi:multidrug transporter EmrE-like cation transporter